MKNIAFCLVLVGIATSCGNESPENGREKEQKFCLDDDFQKKIAFTEATEDLVSETIHLTGSVEANPDKVVNFVSLVSGVVVNTHFSLGDNVKKGQVLIELRSAELSALQAEYSALKSQIKVAERSLKSVQSMYEEGISSEKELFSAQSELNVLKANELKISSDLALYQASPEKGVFQIKAAASGFITSKNVTSGMSVTSDGESLFTISDLNDVWVMANVYAGNVKNIHEGMKVTMTTLSYGDELFEGKISVISHVLDEEAKVLKARIVLDNSNLKLKPGMLVDIHALKETQNKAVSIPTSALIFSDNQNYVIVHKDKCNLEVRKVEILTQNSHRTFISEGLNDKESVISKNQLLVFEAIR